MLTKMTRESFVDDPQYTEYEETVQELTDTLRAVAKILRVQKTANERYAFLEVKDALIRLGEDPPKGEDRRGED